MNTTTIATTLIIGTQILTGSSLCNLPNVSQDNDYSYNEMYSNIKNMTWDNNKGYIENNGNTNSSNDIKKEGATVLLINKYEENIKRLDSFLELGRDWNYNNAERVSEEFVEKMRVLLTKLEHQPDIFPNTQGHISFQYEKSSGEFISFEYLPNNNIKIFKINTETFENESTEIIKYSEDIIIKVVSEFHDI